MAARSKCREASFVGSKSGSIATQLRHLILPTLKLLKLESLLPVLIGVISTSLFVFINFFLINNAERTFTSIVLTNKVPNAVSIFGQIHGSLFFAFLLELQAHANRRDIMKWRRLQIERH